MKNSQFKLYTRQYVQKLEGKAAKCQSVKNANKVQMTKRGCKVCEKKPLKCKVPKRVQLQ